MRLCLTDKPIQIKHILRIFCQLVFFFIYRYTARIPGENLPFFLEIIPFFCYLQEFSNPNLKGHLFGGGSVLTVVTILLYLSPSAVFIISMLLPFHFRLRHSVTAAMSCSLVKTALLRYLAGSTAYYTASSLVRMCTIVLVLVRCTSLLLVLYANDLRQYSIKRVYKLTKMESQTRTYSIVGYGVNNKS